MEYGSIRLFLGPMFSGKSTRILNKVRQEQYSGKKCLMIKYSGDNRYDENMFSTHDEQKHKATSVKVLSEVDTRILDTCNVIGIDEGQFFSDLIEFCDEWVKKGKKIFIAALDSTFEQKSWPVIDQIYYKADKIKKLSARCSVQDCGKKAGWSHLKKEVAEQNKHNGNKVIIGGFDKYIPVCRLHFDELNSE